FRRYERSFERNQPVFERLSGKRGDDLAVLDECVRAEMSALSLYQAAAGAGDDLSCLLARHTAEIARAHAVLSTMREGLDEHVHLLLLGGDARTVLRLRDLHAVCERSAHVLAEAAARMMDPTGRTLLEGFQRRRELDAGKLASLLLLHG